MLAERLDKGIRAATRRIAGYHAAVDFFRQNAGYSYPAGADDATKEHCRLQIGRKMAKAEHYAEEAGSRYWWEVDEDIDSSDFRDDCEPYPLYVCVLYDQRDNVLTSLGGIDFGEWCDPWSNDACKQYRRIVEAELAAEMLTELVDDARR